MMLLLLLLLRSAGLGSSELRQTDAIRPLRRREAVPVLASLLQCIARHEACDCATQMHLQMNRALQCSGSCGRLTGRPIRDRMKSLRASSLAIILLTPPPSLVVLPPSVCVRVLVLV